MCSIWISVQLSHCAAYHNYNRIFWSNCLLVARIIFIGQCNGKVHVTCNYKDLKIQWRKGKENVKTTTLNLHHTFCTFLCRICITTMWKCSISRFMENINKQWWKSNFSFETWICPWICSIGIQLQLGLPTFDKVSV